MQNAILIVVVVFDFSKTSTFTQDFMLANDSCQTQQQQDDDSCSDGEDSSQPSCTYRSVHHSFVGTSIRQGKLSYKLNIRDN